MKAQVGKTPRWTNRTFFGAIIVVMMAAMMAVMMAVIVLPSVVSEMLPGLAPASALAAPQADQADTADRVLLQEPWQPQACREGVPLADYDYGDAPDPGAATGVGNYNTTESDGGPNHLIIENLRLGSVDPDADDGTLQGVSAGADDTTGSPDDEDGVTTMPAMTMASTSVPLAVSVLNNTGFDATLVCWIDFNQNGVFNDAREAAPAATVKSRASQQTIDLTFTPVGAPITGFSYLRCRIANQSSEVALPTGDACSGEVEDYLIEVLDLPLSVDLGYVYAERGDDGAVSFVWETATESGNAGFNLYMAVDDNQVLVNPVLVNPEMIASSVIDSVVPVRYTYAADVDGVSFFIELVGLSGERTRFGPFSLGVAFGSPSGSSSNPDQAEMTEAIFLPFISAR